MPIRHPSNAKLLRWLETGETGKIDDHVAGCERCADRLLVLDGDQSDETGGPERRARRERLSEMLSTLYSAPDDLNERVVEGVERRSKGERELALFAGLMAVGFDTARLITTGPVLPIDHGDPQPSRYPAGDGSGDASGRPGANGFGQREDES